jgi:hypothetical protein
MPKAAPIATWAVRTVAIQARSNFGTLPWLGSSEGAATATREAREPAMRRRLPGCSRSVEPRQQRATRHIRREDSIGSAKNRLHGVWAIGMTGAVNELCWGGTLQNLTLRRRSRKGQSLPN